MKLRKFGVLSGSLFLTLALASSLLAADTATLTGRVIDQSEAVVPGVAVEATNVHTNITYSTTTNELGLYVIPNLPPGTYRIFVRKDGFRTIIKPDVVLHVQDVVAQNFTLAVGSVAESVTVEAGAPLINTESGTVSTVVDRQFVGNIPLNGRSLQSLITLVPGVVRTPADGQFSVNGQRGNANYFTIDGTSANMGMSPLDLAPQQFSGTLPALTALGTTNNLIAIDALEEFRIQTSTFAPEFGRTPGGQVALVSRSGSNEFHGALFNYLRNDALDANDWFANAAGLEKAPLRQNQFGGVLGGPLIKNRTFFFFSYEGLRLRQPQTRDILVPALRLRQNAPPAVQLLLNAFPVPTGPEIGTTGQAPFTGVWSEPTTMNATSLRIDHTFTPRFTLFGRYNQAPSRTVQRFRPNLANLFARKNETRALTLGATLSLTPRLHNELRANYSQDRATFSETLDNFGGAAPFTLSQVLPPVLAPNQTAGFEAFFLNFSLFLELRDGNNNLQRQLNLVDNLSYVTGRHQLKFGVDYRRLAPRYAPMDYFLDVVFDTEDETRTGTASSGIIFANQGVSPLLTNFSAFAQDTWKVTPRLTLTYGLRWDVNPAPTEAHGKQPFILQGFEDLGTATPLLLPAGERLWKTQYANFAPRVGVAYQLTQRPGWETVVRGGFGLFYDLESQGPDALVAEAPFFAFTFFGSVPYPLTPTQAAPPPLGAPNLLHAFDPNLKLPYTYQGNVALEQALGANQSLTASYVAAVGRRQLVTRGVLGSLSGISPQLLFLKITTNGTTSDYHALQIQFQRRLSRGLQALASYTWSHAIDEISGDMLDTLFAFSSPILRGDADFDVRHNSSAAITYDIPSPIREGFGKAALGNWAIDTIIRAQSAYPFTPEGDLVILPDGSFFFGRPNVVPGVPFYLDDPTVPGGRRVNPAAFEFAPPGEQGNAGRNILRGFPLHQVDFALRRTFPLGERLKLQFRVEAFNLFNHPNFALPERSLTSPLFGQATRMFGRSLAGFSGGLSPLYETGGPRSMQFALRFEF